MFKLWIVYPMLAQFRLTLHQVQADESPVEGYSIEEFSWEVETTPGGPTVVLNGTVEKVLSQVRGINPNYEAEFATVVPEIVQPA